MVESTEKRISELEDGSLNMTNLNNGEEIT